MLIEWVDKMGTSDAVLFKHDPDGALELVNEIWLVVVNPKEEEVNICLLPHDHYTDERAVEIKKLVNQFVEDIYRVGYLVSNEDLYIELDPEGS